MDNIKDKILKLQDNSKTGYIFQVDLEYPNTLHDIHNDYPLAPENIKGEYSSLMKKVMEQHKIKENQVSKLIPNLNNKNEYVVHYKNLQLYLEKGLKIKKIHKVLSFDQSPWLKSYIDFNTEQRKKAEKNNNEFEKDFFKLMNNSVFGKTMENVRNRIDVKLRTNDESAQKLANKPNVRDFKIINEDLIAMHMTKKEVLFNKPVIVGFCVLELSKTFMYDFHYNYIKKNYGNKATLLFTDTDSLCYHIETKDIYKDMEKEKDIFDFSNYEEDHFLFDLINAKVLGKMKDEAGGKIILEFCGLRSKMYSFIIHGDVNDGEGKKRKYKKGKGIQNCVVKNSIRHTDYRKCILNYNNKDDVRQTAVVKSIRHKNHQLMTLKINKVGLCCIDDKRYILNNNIETLAHGHYKIEEIKNNN